MRTVIETKRMEKEKKPYVTKSRGEKIGKKKKHEKSKDIHRME